jgi:hypothetical protein
LSELGTAAGIARAHFPPTKKVWAVARRVSVIAVTNWRFRANDRRHKPVTVSFETPLPAENL